MQNPNLSFSSLPHQSLPRLQKTKSSSYLKLPLLLSKKQSRADFFLAEFNELKNKTKTTNLQFLINKQSVQKILDSDTRKLILDLLKGKSERSKDGIIQLKQKVNRTFKRYNELKIAYSKLSSEKKENDRILEEAIKSSQLTQNPIRLSSLRTSDNTFLTPPIDSQNIQNAKNCQIFSEICLTSSPKINQNFFKNSEIVVENREQGPAFSNNLSKINKSSDCPKTLDTSLSKEIVGKNVEKGEGENEKVMKNVGERSEGGSEGNDGVNILSKIKQTKISNTAQSNKTNKSIISQNNQNNKSFSSTIPAKNYVEMKNKSEISLLRHKLLLIQEKIKDKNEEIFNINKKSKIKNLREESDDLLEILGKLRDLDGKKNELEFYSIPMTRSYFKCVQEELKFRQNLNKSLIDDSIKTKEKYIQLKSSKGKIMKNNGKKMNDLNDLLVKYNVCCQKEKIKDHALKCLSENISKIDEIKKEIESNKEERKSYEDSIGQLKAEYDEIAGKCSEILTQREKLEIELNTSVQTYVEKEKKLKKIIKNLTRINNDLAVKIRAEKEKNEYIKSRMSGTGCKFRSKNKLAEGKRVKIKSKTSSSLSKSKSNLNNSVYNNNEYNNIDNILLELSNEGFISNLTIEKVESFYELAVVPKPPELTDFYTRKKKSSYI